jgi:LuxR family transcriptional regulator, maltose regulon positive regulatory protein
MPLPFVTAKTRIPLPTTNLVSRPRLLAALDTCLHPNVQVMLVAAPAGAGKTTLLAQWLGHLPADVNPGWLSLDESDNSLARFLAYLFAATPGLKMDFAAQVESNPTISAEQGVAFLVEQVTEVESNLLLVLDDYHVITAPEIHQALKLLIDHLPPNLRLVIAGRVEPPLPLARLRARGQLVEVRAADLRFNVDETAAFLARFAGLESLAGRALLSQRLAASTEGWAAGLQMSVLALRGELSLGSGEQAQVLERFVDGLGGSQRYILDFLLDEVLSREPERIREFLLRTCLLERFNADLCAALCSDKMDAISAQSMLEELECANLFIIPLDGQREWYRYHHLFADMLQKQLLHTHPGLALTLHRRAADWFEQQGMIDEAIAHAHQSGEAALPRILVEKYALEAILRGQFATAISWLDNLPADVLMSSPRLCLNRAWALTFTFQTEAAIPYLERAESLLRDNSEAILPVRSEVFGLKSYRENMYGHPAEAIRLAKLALENAPADDSFLQCCGHLFLAGAYAHAGRVDESVQEYRAIQPVCRERENLAGLALLKADYLHDLAIYLHAAGKATQAKALLVQAIHELNTEKLQPAALYLHVGLGKLLFNENDLEGSERTLEAGLRFDPLALSIGALDGWLALWRVKIGKGERDAARDILKNLERSTRGCDEKVVHMVIVTAALQDLLENKVDSAAQRMEQLGLSANVDEVLHRVSDSELASWRHNEFYTYARLLMTQQKFEDSLKVLRRLEGAAQTVHMDYLVSRAQIMQAVVHFQGGDVVRAMQIMAHLLERTARMDSNAARIYLPAGDAGKSLLQEAARRGFHPEHISRLLSEFTPEPAPVKRNNLPEALTERELDVLRLMADGLRNQEIGAKLYISLNTVRYHSKNIFGKLGVDNRTAAVARAREMNLLT